MKRVPFVPKGNIEPGFKRKIDSFYRINKTQFFYSQSDSRDGPLEDSNVFALLLYLILVKHGGSASHTVAHETQI